MEPRQPPPPPVTRRVRPDGAVEYRCWQCGRLLIVGKLELGAGEWVQAHCRSGTCKRERRFTASPAEDRPR